MDEDPRRNGKKSDSPSSPRKPSANDADGTDGKPAPGTETPALTLQSPSSSTCSLPTAVMQTPATTAGDFEGQKRLIFQQIQILFGLSVFSFAALLYLLLPATALVILSIFVSSLTSIAYLMYQSAMLEWRSIVRGRGLGQYIPDSVYQQLANQSVHEWMSDPSFYLEWRYLILYFVPGITQEQLDSYLERLPPRHRQVLNRPGLGQFLGDDFMRVLMGESRWRPRQIEADHRELLLRSTSRQLFEVIEDNDAEEEEKGGEEERKEEEVRHQDDDSFSIDVDLGLDDLDVDEMMAGGQQSSFFATFVGLSGFGRQRREPAAQEEVTPPRPMEIVSRSQPPAQNKQDEVDAEGAIMSEAYTAMVVSYTSMAVSTATGAAAQAVESISPYVIHTGLGVASVSFVIGSIGTMLGVYHPSSVSTPTPHFPSARSLWNTALFGGASAGVMLIVRGVVRRSRRNARIEQAKKDDKGEDENKRN